MTIDGQPASSPQTLKVVNPATGQVFAEVPDCTPEQLDVAMRGAQRALRDGKTTTSSGGPALPILTYRTVPEAIQRANATNYGLGASVWSSRRARSRPPAPETR